MDFSDLRRDFGKFGLDESELPGHPVEILNEWLESAKDAGIVEFNSMVLSTVDLNGKPSSRVVLLKGIDKNNKLVFYTNYLSRKGREARMNPNVALNFYWRELERQVRIEGVLAKTSPSVSEAYFKTRPLESQLNAIVSPQSEVIDDLQDIKKQADQLFVSGEKISIPQFWGGYCLAPETVEFWQGGKNRLHDRIRFHLHNERWVVDRLAP